MNRYLAGTSVKISIPLTDRFGNAVPAASPTYQVIDQDGTVKVASTAVTAVNNAVEVTVPASANSVTNATAPRELRKVVVTCDDGVTVSGAFVVERDDPLLVGINSFQTLEQAEMTSMELAVGDGWDLAEDGDKIRAMADAWNRITTLSFDLLNINRPQDSVSYVAEGAVNTGARVGLFNLRGNIRDLTPEQFLSLPPIFLKALRQAQVMDSTDTLDPDPVRKKRMSGLILDTIGETKQMFTSARPIDSACSPKAMKILSRFLTNTITTGRA